MCGITGIKAFNEVGRIHMIHLTASTQCLAKRGPDFQKTFNDYFVGLGHCRLSIIDVSENANQPMSDPAGRYHIIFNGEIFNYKQLRQSLMRQGISFRTQSDTEVLLQLYMLYGKESLNHLNGFFAFAIYDSAKDELFIARDRLGIKPLYYCFDDDKLLFASEMKAILAYKTPKKLSEEALLVYLQLNYIPAPLTILDNIYKLQPGHFILVNGKEIAVGKWYEIPFEDEPLKTGYHNLQVQLRELLFTSVKQRLIADVPVGTFLSGGIDSSVITGIAAKLHPGIHSFSIGYKDHPFFDETKYAELVASHFGTAHEVFLLSNDDLLNHLDEMLDYIDEPFADSSALPVFILSKETKKRVSVALSGDGADELFGGYNKHIAWQKSLRESVSNSFAAGLLPVWKRLPASRSSKLGNTIRQLARFGEGLKLKPEERYWRWASFVSEELAKGLLASQLRENLNKEAYRRNVEKWCDPLVKGSSLNHFLHADSQLVLPDDMLTKVDRMSMANGLEVRVPFLDHRIVAFAFSLPEEYKLKGSFRKRIVQDAFRNFLPQKLYSRPKKGFEVPLLHWMRNDLKSRLNQTVFDQERIKDQGVFDSGQVLRLRTQLLSSNPGDAHATVWALFVFQQWWDRYMTD